MHGDLVKKGRILAVGSEDLLGATEAVRGSILRFIALGRERSKTEVMKSLDDAIFDSGISGRLESEVKEHWQRLGADVYAAIDSNEAGL